MTYIVLKAPLNSNQPTNQRHARFHRYEPVGFYHACFASILAIQPTVLKHWRKSVYTSVNNFVIDYGGTSCVHKALNILMHMESCLHCCAGAQYSMQIEWTCILVIGSL